MIHPGVIALSIYRAHDHSRIIRIDREYIDCNLCSFDAKRAQLFPQIDTGRLSVGGCVSHCDHYVRDSHADVGRAAALSTADSGES